VLIVSILKFEPLWIATCIIGQETKGSADTQVLIRSHQRIKLCFSLEKQNRRYRTRPVQSRRRLRCCSCPADQMLMWEFLRRSAPACKSSSRRHSIRRWRSRRYLVSSGRTATQSISTRILIKPAWTVVRTGRFSSKNSLYTSLYSAKRVGSVR
jgi:hypothetical protein